MKKIILFLILIFISSCSSNKVCGGSGGKRCVNASNTITQNKIS